MTLIFISLFFANGVCQRETKCAYEAPFPAPWGSRPQGQGHTDTKKKSEKI